MSYRVGILSVLVILALALPAWALNAETVTISSTARGVTAGLCSYGTPAAPAEYGVFLQILDATVYYTINGTTPSSSVGGVLAVGQMLIVDRASDFKAVAVAGDARAYFVCVK